MICDTVAEPGQTFDGFNSKDPEYSTKAWYEGSTECVYTGYGGEYDSSTGILKIGGAQSHAGLNYSEYDYCESWGFEDPYGLDNCKNYTNYDNLGEFFGTNDLPEYCFNEDVSEYATDSCGVHLYPNLPTGYNIMRSGDLQGACSGLGWDPALKPFTSEQYANIRYSATTNWPQIQEYNSNIHWGCTDTEACNYSTNIDFDDIDSCTYPGQYYNCDGTCITDTDGDGVCDENDLSIVDESIPTNYNINTIYPNPFNPITTISFSIPQSGLVILNVYDITGRVIITLKNEYMSVGYYNINWDASFSPSGIYFVKMMSEGFVDIDKVVLVK
jgi:hypothetical protein